MAKNAVHEWDTSAASNLDIGGISIAEGQSPATVNNAEREFMAQLKKAIANQGTNIASSGTIDLGAATGQYVKITGTTTITALGTVAAGTTRDVEFTGALILTHNATSLILPGAANITTAAGDCARFVSEGSGNWRCLLYQKASGLAVVVAAAPTITYELVQSNTPSNAAQSDFQSLTSTYFAYVFEVDLQPATDGTTLTALLEVASSFVAANYQYHRTALDSSAGTYSGAASGSAAALTLTSAIGNAGGEGVRGTFVLHNPASTSSHKICEWRLGVLNGSTVFALSMGGGSYSGGVGAVTGVRFAMASGNLTGTIKMYGMRAA